jgi:uncharacterized protein (TIGR02466 family)
MEVIDIFKIPIFCKKIELDSQKIIKECLSLKEESQGRICTNIGGWQSNDILNNKVFDDLVTEVISTCFDVSNVLKLKIVGQIKYWANVNQYSHFNRQHIHPGCILSAVYYAKCSDNSGEIVFLNPPYNIMGYSWANSITDYNNYNSTEYKIFPEEGLLVVFPSWLEHYVGVNQDKSQDRISISFNII